MLEDGKLRWCGVSCCAWEGPGSTPCPHIFSRGVRTGALQTRRGTSYSREILQSVTGVCERQGVAKTKSLEKPQVVAGAPEPGEWVLKEALAECVFFSQDLMAKLVQGDVEERERHVIAIPWVRTSLCQGRQMRRRGWRAGGSTVSRSMCSAAGGGARGLSVCGAVRGVSDSHR